MGTDRRRANEAHDAVLQRIEEALASDLWEGRLSIVDLARDLLRDIPSERTVERLVEILDRLAQDPKWEIRRAVVHALVEVRRPAARSIIERLKDDTNQWVRQAAEQARRKLDRVTTPAAKVDRRAQFAYERIKNLDTKSPEKVYEAAVLIGERYYEELAGDTAHELNTYRAAMEGLLQELEQLVLPPLVEDRRRSGRKERSDAAESAQPSQGLGEKGVEPELREVLDKIRGRFQYLKTLTKGLLEYSRNAGLEFERVPLGPLVDEALDLARAKASAYLDGREVAERLAVPAEITLEGCRERLVQALANILSNAFEAFADKPGDGRDRVEISARMLDSDRIVLTITDTGPGMDAAQLESATKRFRSLKKQKGGIGLGLPLALKIITQEHKGSLDIESTLGEGTTVTIELPTKQKREGA
jgi:signal transduction histidine kinase